MLTLFAIMDKLSAEFTLNVDGFMIQESSERMVQVIENCQRSRSIREMIRKTDVPLDHATLMEFLQRGTVLN